MLLVVGDTWRRDTWDGYGGSAVMPALERVAEGHAIEVRDRREMLTPLLERRTQVFRIEGGVSGEHVMHRRYITPQHAANLLEEAGYGSVRWVQDYDLTTARTVEADDRPSGPFLMIGEL